MLGAVVLCALLVFSTGAQSDCYKERQRLRAERKQLGDLLLEVRCMQIVLAIRQNIWKDAPSRLDRKRAANYGEEVQILEKVIAHLERDAQAIESKMDAAWSCREEEPK